MEQIEVVTLPSYSDVERIKASEQKESERYKAGDSSLGTDTSFVFALFLSFCFSWVGLLIVLCIETSLATFYGGFAGFGMSLIGWMFLVDYFDLYALDGWVLVLSSILGVVIFTIVVYLYIRAKIHAKNTSICHKPVFNGS